MIMVLLGRLFTPFPFFVSSSTLWLYKINDSLISASGGDQGKVTKQWPFLLLSVLTIYLSLVVALVSFNWYYD